MNNLLISKIYSTELIHNVFTFQVLLTCRRHMIRSNKTNLFPWNSKNTSRNGINKTYTGTPNTQRKITWVSRLWHLRCVIACICLCTCLKQRRAKKAGLVWFKKLQGVQPITCLKQQLFLSFTFYKTQRSY